MPKRTDDRAKDLLMAALERPSVERAAFLAKECNGDEDLRTAVSSLLRAHDVAEGTFAPEAPATTEHAGDRIGHYKLLQQIGEGGFGMVWMAEQEEPVRRKVALKVLKAGMDTRQVVGRFEAERQALAMMDHPHIAKVFDGGATAQGRPYFVMELVKGVPITQYCDEAGFSTQQRLELFVPVCQAVQHAHQKGVIHRDLKPSNVLVTLHDGRPVPKVIDFGIAKATSGALTDKTVFTEFRQMLGTPEYMAPEQAELSGLDVDTRADIYSLGVLLYELLTGTRPFELKTLLEAGYAEMLRTIREVDPPKPSTRVSTMGERLADVAKHRSVPPKALGALFRGDVDWIVMKAMEKERSRRYETASALAEDVRRHLQHEPVLASPPSGWYRVRKYARRHRVGVLASAAIAVSLMAGVIVATLGWQEASVQAVLARTAEGQAKTEAAESERARGAEQKLKEEAIAQKETEARLRSLAQTKEDIAQTAAAKARRIVDLMTEMLGSSDPGRMKGKDYTVRQLLDDFSRDLEGQLPDDPGVESPLRFTIALTYMNLGLADQAEPQLARARELAVGAVAEQSLEWAELHFLSARVLGQLGRRQEALAHCEKGMSTLRELGADVSMRQAQFHLQVAGLLANDLQAEEQHLQQALAIATQLQDKRLRQHSLVHYANFEVNVSRYESAEQHLREALELATSAGNGHDPMYFSTLESLGDVLGKRGSFAEADAVIREAEAGMRRLGSQADLAILLRTHGHNLRERGNYTEAEKYLRESLALGSLPGSGGCDTKVELAMVLLGLDRVDEAEQLAQTALDEKTAAVGVDGPYLAYNLEGLAHVRAQQGRTREELELRRRAFAIRSRVLQAGDYDLEVARCQLAAALTKSGQAKEAEPMLRQALNDMVAAGRTSEPVYAHVLGAYGTILLNLGDAENAVMALQKAIDVCRQIGQPDRDAAREAHFHLSQFFKGRGQHQEALDELRALLDSNRRVRGDNNLETASNMAMLAEALETAGEFGQAEAMYRQAVVAMDASGDADLATRGKLRGYFANLLHRVGKFAEAAEAWRGLCDLLVAEKAPAADLRAARWNWAAIMHRMGRFAETEAELRESLAEARRTLPADDPELAVELIKLSSCLLGLGNPVEAEPLLRECLTIRAVKRPGTAGHYNALSYLGEALFAQGKTEAAEPLLLESATKFPTDAATDYYRNLCYERVVRLYEAKGDGKLAAEWRAKIEAIPAAAKAR